MDALRKKINFLTIFYISHKSYIKIFLNGILKNALRTLINRTLQKLNCHHLIN